MPIFAIISVSRRPLHPRADRTSLTNPLQAIWLVPTDAFKRATMEQRHKGDFGHQVRDPERAANNLLQRDRLLTDRMKAEVVMRGMTIVEVDGSQTVDTLAVSLAARLGL